MRKCIILSVVAMLVACARPQPRPEQPQQARAATATSHEPIEFMMPPEIGRRKPNTPFSSDNMPLFDTVTYCLLKTRNTDTKVMGPKYEKCIEDQDHTHSIIGEAIDAGKFPEDNVVRCAKESHTAYEGEWLCMNGQQF